jgi:hypothetical protein
MLLMLLMLLLLLLLFMMRDRMSAIPALGVHFLYLL